MRLTKIVNDPSYGGCGGVILAKCENCTTRLSSCYEEDCGMQNEANQKLAVIENMMCDADGNEVISIARLRELAGAERGGCVVVLPCKVGDTLYIPSLKKNGFSRDHVYEQKVDDILVSVCDKQGNGFDVFSEGDYVECYTNLAEAAADAGKGSDRAETDDAATRG